MWLPRINGVNPSVTLRASRSADGVTVLSRLHGALSVVTPVFTSGRSEAVPGTFAGKSKSAIRAFVRFAVSTSCRLIDSGRDRSRPAPIAWRAGRGGRRARAGKPITLSRLQTVGASAASKTIGCCAVPATSQSRLRGVRNEASSRPLEARSQPALRPTFRPIHIQPEPAASFLNRPNCQPSGAAFRLSQRSSESHGIER